MDPVVSSSVLGVSSAIVTTFGLVFLAEIGDKSQLVCMALAAKHRYRPVLWGALAAFAVLNLLAVVFGATLAHWVPERLLAFGIAVLFGVFGVLSLRAEAQDDCEEIRVRSGRGLFATTFLMLFLAEMGDKTQLAVGGMAATLPAVPVWIGATLALGTTSALGVLVGTTLLRRIPLHRLHQLSGIFFLILAAFALAKAAGL
ncbi:TMEM165/GDT1 family protein [Thiohalocapsa marina]|uniref:GDT1 family protein n=1 Tax=Thiohalocapsa marina TaxID=424902 RepID=A0A5M8FHZ9_9GAMM|nr:TMEM165/GDT1 family protein [Thiohalocapsa marina]KAA6184528.1 TMEM165/GDT1 family protein [Thiohalocapsa marina]